MLLRCEAAMLSKSKHKYNKSSTLKWKKYIYKLNRGCKFGKVRKWEEGIEFESFISLALNCLVLT